MLTRDEVVLHTISMQEVYHHGVEIVAEIFLCHWLAVNLILEVFCVFYYELIAPRALSPADQNAV